MAVILAYGLSISERFFGGAAAGKSIGSSNSATGRYVLPKYLDLRLTHLLTRLGLQEGKKVEHILFFHSFSKDSGRDT